MVRVDTTQWPASGGGVQVLPVLVAVFALIVCLVFLIERVVVFLRPGKLHMPGKGCSGLSSVTDNFQPLPPFTLLV